MSGIDSMKKNSLEVARMLLEQFQGVRKGFHHQTINDRNFVIRKRSKSKFLFGDFFEFCFLGMTSNFALISVCVQKFI